MLYPFPWVNDPRRRTAAAAGGCVLLRRQPLSSAPAALRRIRDEIIDDCALARRIKREGREGGGSIWLGLTPQLAQHPPL